MSAVTAGLGAHWRRACGAGTWVPCVSQASTAAPWAGPRKVWRWRTAIPTGWRCSLTSRRR